MKLNAFQIQLAELIASSLIKHHKVVESSTGLRTGMGAHYIYCEVAAMLKSLGTTSVLLNASLVEQQKHIIKRHFPDCGLRINDVSVDYIIDTQN